MSDAESVKVIEREALELMYLNALEDSKRLDAMEQALATDRIVSVECGYYDHNSRRGGFFLCTPSGSQICGHSIREAVDKLEEQDHE